MEHYLNHINTAIKKYWDMPAYCNFGAETFTYGDVAAGIEKYHILFKECGIKKDDKMPSVQEIQHSGESLSWLLSHMMLW
jgi:hypothetical protein